MAYWSNRKPSRQFISKSLSEGRILLTGVAMLTQRVRESSLLLAGFRIGKHLLGWMLGREESERKVGVRRKSA